MSVPNAFTAGTQIQSAAVNANFSDVASEITNSVAKDGQSTMTGQLKAASGTAAAPGIAFGSDLDTGLFRKTGDTIGFAAGGSEVASLGPNGFADSNAVAIVGMPTGAMMMYGATSAPTGWVRLNGRTIGDASSSATERANADTESLFTFLWTNYGNGVCSVSTGRGASAAADYAAHKTISLPDLRGRSFSGLDGMGNSAAGRLGSVISSQTTNGSSGGTETVTLIANQVPIITPTGVVNITDPTHSHLTLVPNGASSDTSTSGGGNRVTGSTTTASNTAATGITAAFVGNQFGGGQPHSNMPPTFLTTFIIKL